MRFSLQDPHLEKLRAEQTAVVLALANGVKIQGRIASFDDYVIMVMGDVPQMVYKSAVATLQVARSSAFRKPSTGTTTAPRPEFNPVARRGEDVQAPAQRKEPVVIVRKKLRKIVPASENS